MTTAPRTLYDKIWDSHVVRQQDDATAILYIDRHLVHEVTSPQAFEGLRLADRKVRRTEATLAVVDHNVPTDSTRQQEIRDPEARLQVETLGRNVRDFGITYFDINDKRQGIVHIVGPEQGFTQPGMTIVCGDSHTSTHGAFGALAFGIGTSEVEHVLATQTLLFKRAKNIVGETQPGAVDQTAFVEGAEGLLHAAIQKAEATPASDPAARLRAVAALRGEVDAFFKGVMVMADDPKLKANRLALLSRLLNLVYEVADLSKLASPAGENAASS